MDALVQCTVCGLRKKPVGRSAPLEMVLCDDNCPGYRLEPYPGDKWPTERDESCGACEMTEEGHAFDCPEAQD